MKLIFRYIKRAIHYFGIAPLINIIKFTKNNDFKDMVCLNMNDKLQSAPASLL